jgi:hypothetical protein
MRCAVTEIASLLCRSMNVDYVFAGLADLECIDAASADSV